MTTSEERVVHQLDAEQLQEGLPGVLRSPADEGTIELIVRRPVVDERELLEVAELDLERGLVGDDWYARGSKSMGDGSSNPDAQLTLANARAVDLVAAGDRERWALAGDQFYVDFDISEANLPAGSRLSLGTAVIEVSALPHDGCVKYSARFGKDAHRFVNSKENRHLNLRGINAKVVEAGTVRRGDAIRKLSR